MCEIVKSGESTEDDKIEKAIEKLRKNFTWQYIKKQGKYRMIRAIVLLVFLIFLIIIVI